jgi:anti-sigma factor ChrR (cupin superfamily)
MATAATMAVHADRYAPALVRTGETPWVASPSGGVARKLLERIGDEVALATSIVRYAPGSFFPSHTHNLGEEFLVLTGTFADEHGSYPAGTYVRNPPGSRHRPFSEGGCTIFVKLRQMLRSERARVVKASGDAGWAESTAPGHWQALLHRHEGETVHLERMEAGCTIPARRVTGGEEILVVDGSLVHGAAPAALERWDWSRNARRDQPVLASTTGALLWVKRGHLARA